MRVAEVVSETERVRSLVLEAAEGAGLPRAMPGQYLVLKLEPPAPAPPLIRSYSLSDASRPGRYRISVRHAEGPGSDFIHRQLGVGSALQITAPRGQFVLREDARPVVFCGAGIGITPLLAMLHALAAGEAPPRPLYWLYGARNGREHPFAAESQRWLAMIPGARAWVSYSRPEPEDAAALAGGGSGRLDAQAIERLAPPRNAYVYLCGPPDFVASMRALFTAAGYAAQDLFFESFGAGESLRPGVVDTPRQAPHAPPLQGEGPRVAFARSGLQVRWDARYASLLELAEACEVPVRWSCRVGVCHTCKTGLLAGRVRLRPEPLQPPEAGSTLICCAMPDDDVVLDL